MHPVIILAIFLAVIVIVAVIIFDKIEKKKRKGIIDKNNITDGERESIDKKREIVDEQQRTNFTITRDRKM